MDEALVFETFRIMNILKKPWRIVLMPRPLPPAAAFAYYVLSIAMFAGELFLGKHYLRWTALNRKSLLPEINPFEEIGVIIDLNVSERDLEVLVDPIIASLPRDRHQFRLRKMKNFFFFHGRTKSYAWEKWLSYLGKLSYHRDPSQALSKLTCVIGQLLSEDIDVVAVGERLIAGIENPFRHVVLSDRRVVPMPVSKRDPDEKDEYLKRVVVNYTTKVIEEDGIFRYSGDETTVLLVGNPGVGKSTIAATLTKETLNNIASVGSRSAPEWSSLDVSCSLGTLDGATPVADSVLNVTAESEHEDADRRIPKARMDALKRPWSNGLAAEVVDSISAIASKSNIVFADVPGKIDDLTKLISVHATHGVILSRGDKWTEDNRMWGDYLREIGIPVVARIKITTGPSMMIRLDRGSGIIGRLHQPSRLMIGWDPFMRIFTEFLMFDVLPGHIDRLRHRIELQVEGREFGRKY
ncbi:MAG: hypothetical protein JWO73_171 [Candidatus Taylorbacteria bacterium]|nr:hypothetical protein [Candidatus Taylorbacteria bacterium]